MFGLIPRTKEAKALETRPTTSPLSLFRNEFDALFDRFFGRWPALTEGFDWRTMPGVEMEETEKAVIVRMDAPGFEAGEFDIQLTGETLRVTAEHKVKGEEGKEPIVQRRLIERVTVPAHTDPEKVEAHYRNGVLELTLTKTEPEQWKKIEVKG